eukprot:9501478-Pyramimonas_sp.AAC.1
MCLSGCSCSCTFSSTGVDAQCAARAALAAALLAMSPPIVAVVFVPCRASGPLARPLSSGSSLSCAALAP